MWFLNAKRPPGYVRYKIQRETIILKVDAASTFLETHDDKVGTNFSISLRGLQVSGRAKGLARLMWVRLLGGSRPPGSLNPH